MPLIQAQIHTPIPGSNPESQQVLRNRIFARFFGTDIPPVPEQQQTLPEPSLGWFRRYTYAWIFPLLRTGYLRPLEENDIFTPEGTKRAIGRLSTVFEANISSYKSKNLSELNSPGKLPPYTLLRALNATFGWRFWAGGVAKLLSDVSMFLNPLIARYLISYTMLVDNDGNPITSSKGIGCAIGISFLMLFGSFCTNIFFYNSTTTGALVRAVLTDSIFKKNLRLSPKSRLEFPNGTITSMLGSDCHRIDFACQWFHFIWTFPFAVITAIVLGMKSIGPSCLVGFALLLIVFLGTLYASHISTMIKQRCNKVTDKRTSIVREILQSMKIIKFYSWEESYVKKIEESRFKESSLLFRAFAIRNVANSLVMAVPTISGLLSFVVLSSTGGSLNPSRIFSSLTTFNVMRLPLMFLPLAFTSSIDAYKALNRIERFLSAPEMDHYVQFKMQAHLGQTSIEVQNASFVWERLDGTNNKEVVLPQQETEEDASYHDELRRQHTNLAEEQPYPIVEPIPNDSRQTEMSSLDAPSPKEGLAKKFDYDFILKNVNLNIKQGELVVVVGKIGSGKTSLLSALSGFMSKISGTVDVSGSMIFAGQPWIKNSTVRDNVTFGLPFNVEKYNSVITACALRRDLKAFPQGDLTMIGERGATLSGGQKARINLARAVYANSNIVLLDDVLSAVDAHVGRFLMEIGIRTFLRDQTVILATHQLSSVKFADKVIYLDGNGNVDFGTSDELKTRNTDFLQLLSLVDLEEDVLDEQEQEVDTDGEMIIYGEENQLHATPALPKSLGKAGITFDVYRTLIYKGSGGLNWGIALLLLTMVILANFCLTFSNVWLSFWTSNRFETLTQGQYIGIFILLAVLSSFFLFAFFFIVTFIGNRASRNMSMEAMKSLVHGPMSFFDSTPIGQMLIRFTQDTELMDNQLIDQGRLFLVSISTSLSTYLLVICYIPWVALVFCGLTVVFAAIASFYRVSARELKKLEGAGRSRVFATFSESLTGVTTINAYHAQAWFRKEMQKSIDRLTSSLYLTLVHQRWLALRLDLIGFVMMLIVTLFCVTHQFKINPSAVGLVVSSLLVVVPMISLIVREMAAVESVMHCAERIYEYMYNIPQEAPTHIPVEAPPPNWPQVGKIKFKNVTMSYKTGIPPALNDFSLSIENCERLGICGRTGAGKSSIMNALLRLTEYSKGRIEIDAVNIKKIGLNDLRSKISIIPQDPVLFSGTIKSNMDPRGEIDDKILLYALERVGLITTNEKKSMMKLREGDDLDESILNDPSAIFIPKFSLDRDVNDEGTNFSLGERQLLALATALAKNSQILIMDEATSNLDFETDQKIQEIIRTEFKNRTILCVAHRLRTILDYDRILVMDNGKIAQYGEPYKLFRDGEGLFRNLCDQSNIVESDIPIRDFTRKRIPGRKIFDKVFDKFDDRVIDVEDMNAIKQEDYAIGDVSLSEYGSTAQSSSRDGPTTVSLDSTDGMIVEGTKFLLRSEKGELNSLTKRQIDFLNEYQEIGRVTVPKYRNLFKMQKAGDLFLENDTRRLRFLYCVNAAQFEFDSNVNRRIVTNVMTPKSGSLLQGALYQSKLIPEDEFVDKKDYPYGFLHGTIGTFNKYELSSSKRKVVDLIIRYYPKAKDDAKVLEGILDDLNDPRVFAYWNKKRISFQKGINFSGLLYRPTAQVFEDFDRLVDSEGGHEQDTGGEKDGQDGPVDISQVDSELEREYADIQDYSLQTNSGEGSSNNATEESSYEYILKAIERIQD